MKLLKLNIKSVLVISFSLFTFHFCNAQHLETLIDEALKNNPEIKSFDLKYKVASEKINEVNTLPNTEVGVGYFISEPETRTGPQRFKVSVKQMMPWFGTITARENYALSIADATYVDIAIAKRKLITSVSQLYYKLYANKAKQSVITENIKLLETYETMALTSVEVGKASAVDVLRLQMRQNELQQLKEVLEQQYLAEEANLNFLLNRDFDVKVNVINNLVIPSEKIEVNTEILELHPELVKYDKLYQSVEQSEILNQIESNPLLGLALDYVNVTERPDMDFNDNGKDILMPMVSISIPIFNNKYKSVSKQNQLKQQKINAQKNERYNTLNTILNKAIRDRMAARINYYTQLENLQKAHNAEEILIKSYETGKIDFNDVLDIQKLQLKFQMSQIESIKNYYINTTIINYLTN